MKRNIYHVKAYDGTIDMVYRNYGCAVNRCIKLIRWNIDCGIYLWNDEKKKFECIIGC